ncbi:hypothetical protein GA0070604_4104 [Micromonospora eburnea]|uniref:Uncharacterized protein n=2 Tax=Micromonospora eburnea TaxID=227316 RepID=A0A1C6V017_9ACTN|nr:hypothetical protein GA0070604_4104 [Micromonospora eburnea]
MLRSVVAGLMVGGQAEQVASGAELSADPVPRGGCRADGLTLSTDPAAVHHDVLVGDVILDVALHGLQ